jgi:hypothetical protein
MKSDKLGRVLRTAAVIMVGLTAAMNILGGVGTTCAAFLTKNFPPMWALINYQWLYQTFVIVTILIGLAGAWTTVSLSKGTDQAVKKVLIVLGAGIIVGAVHVFTSLSLRGKATPADVKLYLNIMTFVFILVLRLPGLRERVNFTRQAPPIDRSTAAGMASIVVGIAILTTHIWAGPSHTFMGENWVLVLQTPMMIAGGGFLIAGLAALIKVSLAVDNQEKASKDPLHAMRA